MGKATLRAEKAFVSGRIVTMNSAQPFAEAIATRKDRVFRVGANKEIAQFIDEKTEVVNLAGKTVIPGFVDAHVHVLDFGKSLKWLELTGISSVRELASYLKEHLKRLPKGRWIVGRGWDETRFEDKRLPTISDLDPVSPNNPVILYRANSLVCVVNSRALRIAGITKSTVSPQDGVVDKDAAGELTGILRDAATDLVWRRIPEPNEAELAEMASAALTRVAEAGITSVHWIVLSSKELSIARKLQAQRKLKIRVYLVIPSEVINEAVASKFERNSMLRLAGGMIIADGYLSAKTAALSRPYADGSSRSGMLFCSQRKLISESRKVLASGFQLVVHATGDKAIKYSLDAIEDASKDLPSKNLRHRIEQPAVLNPAIVERLKRQNITLSVQPCVIASEFVVWKAKENLGADRARWLYPLRSLSNAGVNVAAGSDCPMEPLNPLLGIQTAVMSDFHPEERINVDEALRMYTVGGAYASKEEKLKGSIEEGKYADLTVLSSDPFSVPPMNIANIAVEMTVVGGKIVFSKNRATSLIKGRKPSEISTKY